MGGGGVVERGREEKREREREKKGEREGEIGRGEGGRGKKVSVLEGARG